MCFFAILPAQTDIFSWWPSFWLHLFIKTSTHFCRSSYIKASHKIRNCICIRLWLHHMTLRQFSARNSRGYRKPFVCSHAGLVLCWFTSCMFAAQNTYINFNISHMPILNSGFVHPKKYLQQSAVSNMQRDTQQLKCNMCIFTFCHLTLLTKRD